jgi:uncharacterized protein (TIGR02391 family)
MTIPSFKASHLEDIVRAVVEAVSHREVGILLRECNIEERGGGPRWERLLLALSDRQKRDGCGNNVGAFLQAALNPARFAGRADAHAQLCETLNRLLAFDGFQITDRGVLASVPKATTVSEAESRASRLRFELVGRKVHPDVLAFCRAELLQENYFHAVLEATKSVAEKIRNRTGLGSDGPDLVDAAFGGSHPMLGLNSLCTETERSEQRGLVNLLKGVFGTFRNPTAHAPRVSWPVDERDAIDLLTIASYLHRRIDASVRTSWAL